MKTSQKRKGVTIEGSPSSYTSTLDETYTFNLAAQPSVILDSSLSHFFLLVLLHLLHA